MHTMRLRNSEESLLHIRVTVSRLVVGVTNIVDTDPKGEHRVRTRPRRAGRFARDGVQELVHLIGHGQDCRLIRGDQ